MKNSKFKIQNYNLKFKDKKILETAVKFHGHLGPYLVLGLLIGNLGTRLLQCKKHFGIKTIIKGAENKPKSCLIDGLQLSTGCTYGKGNICKKKGRLIRVFMYNLDNHKRIKISLKKNLIKRLDSLNNHRESESFAMWLFRQPYSELFDSNF